MELALWDAYWTIVPTILVAQMPHAPTKILDLLVHVCKGSLEMERAAVVAHQTNVPLTLAIKMPHVPTHSLVTTAHVCKV